MKVYIAGPYSQGDQMKNIRDALQEADDLVRLGHTPYIPHLAGFWHFYSPKKYEFWLAYDLEWLKCCDCVLRIPGPSNGADKEELYARRNNMPVYFHVEDIPTELERKESKKEVSEQF